MDNIIEQVNQIIATIEPLYAEATKQCEITEKPYKDLNVKMKKHLLSLCPTTKSKKLSLNGYIRYTIRQAKKPMY